MELLLQLDLNGPALSPPVLRKRGCLAASAPCDHYSGVAADPHRAPPDEHIVAPHADLSRLEWLAMPILSGFLMLGVSLFTTSTINQALAVLGADASCWRGEGRKRMIRIGKSKTTKNCKTQIQKNVNLMLVC